MRALVVEVNQGGSWVKRAVILASRKGVQARPLPGDRDLSAFLRTALKLAVRPSRPDGTPGSWEDWIGWALEALSNGHDHWLVEVKPELTLKRLYQREVLGMVPEAITTEKHVPVAAPPELHGWRIGVQNPRGLPQ